MSWDLAPAELATFAEQLTKLEETERTGQALQMQQGAFEHGWRKARTLRCCESGIPVPVPRKKGLHPVQSDVIDATMCFIFTLGEDVEASKLPSRADFQVCVTGVADYAQCSVELQDHWRVDTHAFGGEPREPHPYLHFQRGGHAQDAWAGSGNFVPGPALSEKRDDYWQSLMQSPGPRVPFPPMCPTLAIDYVIGQHDGDTWKRLRNIPEYTEAIRTAQERLWTPFFEGLAKFEVRRRWLGPCLLNPVLPGPLEL